MKKLILAITLLCVLTQCDEASYRSADPINPNQPDLSVTKLKVIDANNHFGLELFKRLVADDPNSNVFISPISIATALAMTANGADGNTLTQMTNTLGFNDLKQEAINQSFKSMIDYLVNRDPKVMTEIANSIWYNENFSFEEAFLKSNHEYFEAHIQGLDFSDERSADTINNWVADRTHNLIDQIVEKPIDPKLVMFLINAIYFKGTWTYQFTDSLTTDRQFRNQDGSQTEVEMMRGDFELKYFSNDEVSMVSLPYGDEKYSMLIVLPSLGTSINQFVDELNQDSLTNWVNGLEEDTVMVGLPKFTMAYEKKLNEILKQMGMVDPFIAGQADFSKMRSQNDLFISLVKHKSFIEVNEEGTEAAAVTVVGMGLTSVGGPKMLIADRPFIFLIQDDESGIILFVGKAGSM